MSEKLRSIYGFTPGWEDKPKAYELFDAFACQSCGLVLPPNDSFIDYDQPFPNPIPCACGGALYRQTLRLEPVSTEPLDGSE